MELSCISVLGNRIRLTDERWLHIVKSHDYLVDYRDLVLEAITNPDEVYISESGEFYALKKNVKTIISYKTCVSIYKDEPNGFIITAILTSKAHKFQKKGELLWHK